MARPKRPEDRGFRLNLIPDPEDLELSDKNQKRRLALEVRGLEVMEDWFKVARERYDALVVAVKASPTDLKAGMALDRIAGGITSALKQLGPLRNTKQLRAATAPISESEQEAVEKAVEVALELSEDARRHLLRALEKSLEPDKDFSEEMAGVP